MSPLTTRHTLQASHNMSEAVLRLYRVRVRRCFRASIAWRTSWASRRSERRSEPRCQLPPCAASRSTGTRQSSASLGRAGHVDRWSLASLSSNDKINPLNIRNIQTLYSSNRFNASTFKLLLFEGFTATDWKDTISGVHVSPGSVETVVRRGGITNHHLIAYSVSNISPQNYRKSVDVRWSYSVLHQCRFLRHSIWYLVSHPCQLSLAKANPPFLIFDIWTLWCSVLSARAPECQKLKMVG